MITPHTPIQSLTAAVIAHEPDASPRIRYGVDRLRETLRQLNVAVDVTTDVWHATDPPIDRIRIYVGTRGTSAFLTELETHDILLYTTTPPGPDGFQLATVPGRLLVVAGGNDTGTLYGCDELARMARAHGEIPCDVDCGETPDLVIRGPAIGLQKTTVEPPRQVYEYPITPDRFPWFYDRELWLELLDRLFELRANVIYLWSGHPFSSFVRLEEYPEAQEVTDDELTLNTETLHWLTTEADRRGIRVVVKFYNIHIPLPFAEQHEIPLYQPKPTPLVADYTRKAIAAFVARYTGVGLYVCLGEVLQGDVYGADWFLDVILAGVHDALSLAGITERPPIILRNHALDLKPVLERARDRYPFLLTEAKYNGESLTTYQPRGAWRERHRFLAEQSDVHIVNVHILANLEPFRYGAVSFIQRSVQAIRHRLHGRGLHLYPLFYWEWPYSPDRVEPRLRQLDRDWLWYEAWHRYAWRADRDPDAERDYWIRRLAERFGTREAGEAILDAYEAMGRIAPQLVRRIGITEGNRQTFSLGMTMSQLTNAERHRPFPDLWESHAPNGERLDTYVERKVAGLPHLGETPPGVIADAEFFAARARVAIERANAAVTRDRAEYERIRDDVTALALVTRFYALRVSAAIDIMAYRQSGHGRADLLTTAADKVDESVGVYRRLAELTDRTYHYANSMQTPQRKVPFPDGSRYGHWRQCLPEFEAEAANLRHNAELIVGNRLAPAGLLEDGKPQPYRPVSFRVHNDNAEQFTVGRGVSVFADAASTIRRLAPELDGLTGIRITRGDAFRGEVAIDLTLAEPAYVLIGYFRNPAPVWAQPPDLEVDAHADTRGAAEPLLRNGIGVDFLPTIDVYAIGYDAGRHMLTLGPGAYVVAGVVTRDRDLTPRDVRDNTDRDSLDWLYETPAAPG